MSATSQRLHRSATPTPFAPLSFSLTETAQITNTTRQHIHNLIGRGEIRSVKLGRARRISVVEVARLLDIEPAALVQLLGAPTKVVS